jgi:UDP-N-acetylmuramate dehydrogenase
MKIDFKRNVSLAPYTTYKIGGVADQFFVASTKQDLVDSIIYAREYKIPYFILGTGANILFADKGFRGLVIKNEYDDIFIKDSICFAGSGALISTIIEKTSSESLSGFEHFAGIPSTVGGAIWQNLHFLSADRKSTFFIESILDNSSLLDENNNIIDVDKSFYNFGYDQSILHKRKDLVVLDASFKLEIKDIYIIKNQIMENLKWRNDKHPNLKDFPSCGSVFKNIEGVGAGRLIDRVGLKGFVIGDAQISQKHANFIVNLGNAKAKDVIDLINLVKEKVLKETGYKLETEISFIGDF